MVGILEEKKKTKKSGLLNCKHHRQSTIMPRRYHFALITLFCTLQDFKSNITLFFFYYGKKEEKKVRKFSLF